MRINMLTAVSALSLTLCFGGCGGGEESASEEPAASGEAAAPAEPAGSASITGTVHFQGTAPERQRIKQVRECEALHEEPVLAENVVVNDNGTLRWVFVRVKEGLGDRTFPAPSEPVELDQEHCMYAPHVFGIQTDQTLKIVNSDPLLHNIHALPEENRPFNFGMPNAGDERERSFREPEVMVRIKCDVHPWMLAWAGVVDNPYYSVTGDDGTFRLENLPAGDYVIEAWQEEYGAQTQNVTVGDGASATVDFTFGEGQSS